MAKNAGIKVKPWCPFCGQNVEKPLEPAQRKMSDFPVGKCVCGAVYAYDATGYNVGAAMVETLVYACNDNWDLAWELTADDDYLSDRIEPYDDVTNQVVETGNVDGRKVSGVLYFIRLQAEAEAIALAAKNSEKVIKRAAYLPALEPERDPKRQKKKATKNMVKEMVEQQDIDGMVDLAFDDIKAIRFMQRLLYTTDESLRWKTIDTLGKTCARFATRKPGKVSDLLHRLFAACTDSASSGWGNIEAIGAIIGERPDIFGSFSHHLLNYLDDTSRQALVLWSLAAIAKNGPDLVRRMPFYQLFTFLRFADPEVRGHALYLLGRIKAVEAKSQIEQLVNDPASITIYENGQGVEYTLAALANQALTEMNDAANS